jgi:hypothetical protein
MAKSIYFNIEDDVKSIIARVRQEPQNELALVFPRRCYLFSDPLNVKLLKKQLDILHKRAAIMTMDERGQAAAAEAGFPLLEVPTRRVHGSVGDMRSPVAASKEPAVELKTVVVETNSKKRVTHPTEDTKKGAVSRPMPSLAVHDTIFSDIPKRSSFVTQEKQEQKAHVLAKTRTIVLGAAALLVLLAFVIFSYVLPKATVVVYAKSEPVNRDLELALATTTKQADVNTLSMPAQTFDKTLEVQDKFETTGKKELGSKAAGQVRVFNLTGASINLKAATTTLAANGKTFVFTTDQNYIKPVSAKALTSPSAGHVASVVATAGGEASNLPAGTRLEITNQVFGSKPQLLYAVVEDAFVGGNSRFVSVVLPEDLTRAQTKLTETAISQVVTSLKAEGQYVAERAYDVSVINFSADKPAGTESTTFNAQLKVQFRGLSFDPVALTDLVRSRVNQVLPPGGHLESAAQDQINFTVRQFDSLAGALKLVVHFESKVYKNLDVSPLAGQLLGKPKQQALDLLAQNKAIDHAEIDLWPSWQSSMPQLSSRIELSQRQN